MEGLILSMDTSLVRLTSTVVSDTRNEKEKEKENEKDIKDRFNTLCETINEPRCIYNQVVTKVRLQQEQYESIERKIYNK